MVGLRFGAAIANHLAEGAEASVHFRLVGVCDLDQGLAAEQAAARGVRHHRDLDAVLSDPDVEVVGIFTPPAGRAELIGRAIRSGRHVITTKPMEEDPVAAARVLAEARALGRLVMLNSPSPGSCADLDEIERTRGQEALGAIVAVRGEVWARYRELPDGGWADDPRRCPAAPLFRLGVYLINDVVALMGEPEEVAVMSSRLFTGRPTADQAQILMRFGDGRLAGVFASFCCDDGEWYRNRLTVNCERGTIYRNVGPLGAEAPMGTCRIETVIGGHGNGRSAVRERVLPAISGQYPWRQFAKMIAEDAGDQTSYHRRIVSGLSVLAAMRRAEASGASELMTSISI